MATRKRSADTTPAIDDDHDFLEHRREMANLAFREERDEVRRLAVAARQRRRLMDAAATKFGLSLSQFDALHEADWKLAQRQLQAQEKAASAVLKRHHQRQRAALRTVLKHRGRFEYRKGNPVVQTCLWRATGAPTAIALPFTFNEGTAAFLPPALAPIPPTPANNLIRLRAGAVAAVTGIREGVAGAEFLTSHVFETTADIDGILTVTALYAPLGTIQLAAPGDCVGFGGRAGAIVTLMMNIRVTTPGEPGIDLPLDATREIVNERIHAGCDGIARLISVGPTGGSAYQVRNEDVATVSAGDVIRITVRFVLRLSATLRGSAVANFSAAPGGLNVPMVLTKISS